MSVLYITQRCISVIMVITVLTQFLPGASVDAGVGPPCAAAEAHHPAD